MKTTIIRNQIRKTKNLCTLGILAVATLLGTGCQVTMKHGPLTGTYKTSKGSLAVSATAQKMNQRIGSGTFTVFAIPVAPVKITGDASRELMLQVKDAVEHSGYSPKLVEQPADAAGLPLLTCSARNFAFKNYTYFFPVVFNWGIIELDFTLQRPDGRVIWCNSYSAQAKGNYSFEATVNEALTSTLNQFIPDLAQVDLTATTKNICPALKSANTGKVDRALKSLRRLNAPDAIPEILPLLNHEHPNIIRDACRTLAVLGNREVIPVIEPLLNHSRKDVRKDAQDAINALKAKI